MHPKPKPEQEESQDRIEFASLPAVTELEDTTPAVKKHIIHVLELLEKTVTERERLEQIEEDCKTELAAFQAATNKPGFRYGLLCFASQVTKGRKTLDKLLLMENGCPASAITASYKEGAPSIRRTFKRLPEDE